MANLYLYDLWEKYLGRLVGPEEYTGDEQTLIADLTDLWLNHPTDGLTADEIAGIAGQLTGLLETDSHDQTSLPNPPAD